MLVGKMAGRLAGWQDRLGRPGQAGRTDWAGRPGRQADWHPVKNLIASAVWRTHGDEIDLFKILK